MAGFRLPGALCAITNAVPVDSGTQAIAAMPAPGVVGPNKPGLDPNDPEIQRHLALIESIKESTFTLDSLRSMRRAHTSMLIDAVFEFGENSKAAQLQRLTLKVLEGLITTTAAIESLPKRGDQANAALEKLVDAAERGGTGAPSLEQIRVAMTKAFGIERQRQLLGAGDSATPLMPLAVRALDVALDRHCQELNELARKGMANPDGVSDTRIREAVAHIFADERQRQLLGAPDRAGFDTAVRPAAQLWFRKRALELERAYQSGSDAAITQAEAAYEEAKRSLVFWGGQVPEGRVGTGAVQLRR